MFTVDSEAGTGIKRISNEEIAEAAQANSDVMLAFASIDPHKGKAGAIEARRLIADYGVRGFKFHPPIQNFHPYDRMAWPLYEVLAEHKLPAIFHTGHSGMGSGMPGGGGIRLKYGQPILVDDVAVDFPNMMSSCRIPAGRGPMKPCRWRSISPMYSSTFLAGLQSIFRPRLSATPIHSLATKCCPARISR
jgi:hypothetical protein